jgi:hypothetical protein
MKDINNEELLIGDFVKQFEDEVMGQIVAIVHENKAHHKYLDLLSDELVINQGLDRGVYLYTMSLGLMYLSEKNNDLNFVLLLRNSEFNIEFSKLINIVNDLASENLKLRKTNEELEGRLHAKDKFSN